LTSVLLSIKVAGDVDFLNALQTAPLISVGKSAALLGVSPATVKRWIKNWKT